MLKISCYALGNIMTEPRSKKEAEENFGLSKTAISYLAELEVEMRTGRRKDIWTKQIEKGRLVEEDSITLYSEVTGAFCLKNETRFENEWIKGIPDIILRDEVIDIKSSWDAFSFPHPWTYTLDKMYYWQLQGYMMLTEKQKATLAYTLVNAPLEMVDREQNFLMNRLSIDPDEEVFINTREIAERKLMFDDIPKEQRVFTYAIDRDDKDIEKIKIKVEQARKFWDLRL